MRTSPRRGIPGGGAAVRSPRWIEPRQDVSTRIVLIRHAETTAGAVLCGWLDVPLAETGRARLGAVLRHPPSTAIPHALYTSTLARAAEVAAALSEAWALEPRRADWAREIHCGRLEGMPLDRLQRQCPELWARNEAQQDEAFAWPGGESYAQFRARVLDGLASVAAAHPDGRVAVVTHAGVISQVLGVIRRRSAAVWDADRPEPLTATEVLWGNGLPAAVVTYNDRDWY